MQLHLVDIFPKKTQQNFGRQKECCKKQLAALP